MKKFIVTVFTLFLTANLFAKSWIFDGYGVKGAGNTTDFFIVFSSVEEAEEWLSKSNKKLSDLRELEPLLGYLQNDMETIVKSGYVMIYGMKGSQLDGNGYCLLDYYVMP